MFAHRQDRRAGPIVPRVCGVLLIPFLAGCDAAPWLQPLFTSRVRDAVALAESQQRSSQAFAESTLVMLPAAGSEFLSGSIAGPDDVAVFSLGPVQAGDRITVDIAGDGGLNTVAALFNDAGELIDANDDRSYYGGLFDPYLSVILREDDPNLHLAVAISRGRFFSSTQGRFDSGSFGVRVDRLPGAPFTVRPQIVWLEFGGAVGVRIAQEPAFDVPPFDAGAIAPRLAEHGDLIRDVLFEKMATDFTPFQVTLLRSDRDERPAGPHSTVFFGGSNSRFLGLADSVDSFNANPSQAAIIFAETLGLFESLHPTPEEVAQALANVGAHELGHLLGLEHTADPYDLMAEAATAQQIFFIDATFGIAPLDADLFPIGTQNARRLLGLAMGMRDGFLIDPASAPDVPPSDLAARANRPARVSFIDAAAPAAAMPLCHRR